MNDLDYILDELPQGWRNTTIGEVCEVISGQHIKTDNYNEEGRGMAYLTGPNDFGDYRPTISKWAPDPKAIAEENDVVITVKGAGVGKVNVLKEERAAISRQLMALRTSDVLYTEYLFYYLQLNFPYFQKLGEGSTVPGINRTNIKETPLPLPSVGLQERIVAKIEELFSKLDSGASELENAQKRLDQHRRAVLKAAITGEISERMRRAESRQSSQPIDQIADLLTGADFLEPDDNYPENWKLTTLGQISDVETGATPLRGNDEYWNGEIPWVKSGAVNDDTIDSADEFITEKALEENNVTFFPPETLIVAMYGQGSTRGKISTLKFEATTNQACAGVIIPDELSFLRPWVKIYFEDHYHELRRKAAGGVQPNLNLGILRSMEIPLPPKKEIQYICDAVERQRSIIQETDRTISESIERSKRLRQSILKHAFEGKLVPQSSKEEPTATDGGDTNLEPGEEATLPEVTNNVE